MRQHQHEGSCSKKTLSAIIPSGLQGAVAAPLPRTEGATTAVSYQGNTGGDGEGLLIYFFFFFELHVDTAL